MKKWDISSRSKKIPFITIGFILLILISVVFLWTGNRDSIQSVPPISAGVRFVGEYKIGDGEWQTITPDKHISSTQGDVSLRGFFQTLHPTTNEPISPISTGATVSLYLDHLGVTIYTQEGHKIILDSEHDIFGEDACAITWNKYTHEGEQSEDPITIVLHNPHTFGNENAIDELLNNLELNPSLYFEKEVLNRGALYRNTGLLIFLSSVIILGIAVFSSIIHIKSSKEMWLIGLMSLFAGGYFIFDAFGVSLWNSSNIINTRTLGLCMMFYMLFVCCLISVLLKGRAKKVSYIATAASAVAILSCILVSFIGNIKFFDTWIYWVSAQAVIAVILIVCQICCFKGSSTIEKPLYIIGSLTLAAFITDAVATKVGWWQGGLISKHNFLIIFIIALVIVLRVIPSHINAAIKARRLEEEQQALKLELQESRISIMLSQMQPHFIFNTLNTIYHLCEIDPSAARKTISSFSEYLRNNIDNLGQSDMIFFEKELSFVKTYLDIEKVRFDDELEISFDISVDNFKIPVLTVQPIVENAVKHGTSKKEGVAQLSISTKETESCYEIIIADTGVGFDVAKSKDDGHKHVGLTNVRERLENLCGGTLTLESEVGKGTVATIKIPKKEMLNNEDTCSG